MVTNIVNNLEPEKKRKTIIHRTSLSVGNTDIFGLNYPSTINEVKTPSIQTKKEKNNNDQNGNEKQKQVNNFYYGFYKFMVFSRAW